MHRECQHEISLPPILNIFLISPQAIIWFQKSANRVDLDLAPIESIHPQRLLPSSRRELIKTNPPPQNTPTQFFCCELDIGGIRDPFPLVFEDQNHILWKIRVLKD